MIPGSTNQLLAAGVGYQISRSVRLRSSASAYFSRSAYPVASTGTQWSMSMWVKRGNLSTANDLFSFVSTAGAAQQAGIQFDSNGAIRWWQYAAPSYQFHKVTTAVFRDPSAWYHLHFVYDTTLATAADRCQIWVNGVRQTAFSTSVDPSLNLVTYYKTGTLYPYIGAENRNASSALTPFDGYLTEINFIDGQALTPSSFGETNLVTGVWQPKKYAGTYGTNGFYLNFSDPSAATAAAIGKDYSGNGNNWTPNNISVTAGATYDSMLDVPTPWPDGGNGRGNYCVLNPLATGGGTVALSAANLNVSVTTSPSAANANFAVGKSGKWYAEFQITSTPENGTSELISVTTVGLPTTVVRAFGSNGQYYNGGAWVAFGSAWSINDIIGIAMDVDNSQLSFYRNGVQQGTTQSYTFADTDTCGVRARGVGTSTFVANFGQRPFAYTPPSGFRALNTQNLPTPTIAKGNQYFDATTFSGVTGGTQSIVNSGSMQPDMVWVKRRDSAGDHYLADSVRGVSNYLTVNSTLAEASGPQLFTAFNSNGFSLGTSGYIAGQTVVGWQWKAGGTPAVTNTAGSITSTVSAGATQGFSVVTYTGTGANATVGHGLGVAPSMLIVKNRTGAANDWYVWHTRLTSGAFYINLNATGAQASAATVWNSTIPTSAVFSLGTSGSANANGTNYVAYLFAAVAGYSAFGSYTGNGSADGPFVFCGFRPRYVMIKRTDTTAFWYVYDTARNTFNVANNFLYPNDSSAEASVDTLDFVSNGLKLRSSNAAFNASGGTYIFAAFAENPTKYALAR